MEDRVDGRWKTTHITRLGKDIEIKKTMTSSSGIVWPYFDEKRTENGADHERH